MIELPTTIVVYPHKLENLSYLLCWIPSESFAAVAQDSEALETLQKYHRNGIEIVCSDEGLAEAGIKLDLPPEEIQEAYRELHETGELPEEGVVELTALQQYLEARARINFEGAKSFGDLSLAVEADVLENLKKNPPMKGEEKPQSVYRRFSAQQAPIEEE